MKRFFSTFLLLTIVASSLIISNNLYKQEGERFTAKESKSSIEKSIDLTEADLYNSKRNTVFVTMPN